MAKISRVTNRPKIGLQPRQAHMAGVNSLSLSLISEMNINAIMADAQAVNTVSQRSLVWKLLAKFIVRLQTARMSRQVIMIASRGATTHPIQMIPSWPQSMVSAPRPAIPQPISAPITVCVPEIGIPKTEEAMMKMRCDRGAKHHLGNCVVIQCFDVWNDTNDEFSSDVATAKVGTDEFEDAAEDDEPDEFKRFRPV